MRIQTFLLLAVLLVVSPRGARAADVTWLLEAAGKAERSSPDRAARCIRAYLLLAGKPDAGLQLKLARLLATLKRWGEAESAYERYLASKPGDRGKVQQEIASMRGQEAASAYHDSSGLKQSFAPDLSARAFGIGRKLALGGQRDEGARYLQAAVILDPTLPGPHRLLGAVYLKQGKSQSAWTHLADYLRVRPDGPLADKIRKMLRGKQLLGEVSARASYPADIWVNGRHLGRKTPSRVQLPAGQHVVTLSNERYHLLRSFRVNVVVDQAQPVDLRFGIVEVKLEPWGRIRANGRDLGLWSELGLPEGEYRLELESHDGKRKAKTRWLVKAGERKALTWKATGN